MAKAPVDKPDLYLIVCRVDAMTLGVVNADRTTVE